MEKRTLLTSSTITQLSPPAAPAVRPSPTAVLTTLTPMAADAVALGGTFWSDRQATNRDASLVESLQHLQEYGALPYLRAAAGNTGLPDVPELRDTHVYKILDSDVAKWVEAVAYESMRSPLPAAVAEAAEEIVELLVTAQTADGACHSWTRVHEVAPLSMWREGHETYCGGHLIQAGVAWHRATGDVRLLDLACRLADFFVAARADYPELLPLHPGLEMALVELYRETGERRFLDQAVDYLERRGHGELGFWKFSPDHFVDDEPIRDMTTIRGHAVMALYLLCGVVDVAVETGDRELLAVAETQWNDMVQTKLYLTGGAGSRQHDEAFGDPYELAPDTAYAETCAAIASIMVSWRLLLATGRSRYADLIEQTVYNGALSGVSLDGASFFYVNPLHVRRPSRILSPDGYGHRQKWFECACCPPNLMRLVSTMAHLVSTGDDQGIQIHQLVAASISTDRARLVVDTDLPFGEPRVDFLVEESVETPWTLRIRQPDWAEPVSFAASWSTDPVTVPSVDGYAAITRTWAAGDRLSMTFDMPVRRVAAHPLVDALRGQEAFMRGPVVLCVEDTRLDAELQLDALQVPPGITPVERVASDDAPVAWRTELHHHTLPAPEELYRPAGRSGATQQEATPRTGTNPVQVELIPYFAWGNRGPARMKVWLPRQD